MLQSAVTPAYSLHSVSLDGFGGAVVASISGSVHYGNAADLRRQLLQILAAEPEGAVVLELGAVESMDTAAAAVLVEILMQGRKRGIQVFLCGASPAVQRLFQLAGLDEALAQCCDSTAEVQQRLSGEAET
jgi:anti-anti-sigma factor